MHQELRRKGVTVMLLWQEYSAQVGEQYCAERPLKALRYSQCGRQTTTWFGLRMS